MARNCCNFVLWVLIGRLDEAGHVISSKFAGLGTRKIYLKIFHSSERMRCKFALGWIHVVVKSLKVDNVWRFGDSDSKWKWKCVERREASACGFSLHGQFAKLWLGTLGSCWCRLGLRVRSRVTAWLVCGDTTKLDTIVVCVWQFLHSAVCSICIHVLDTFLFEPWVEWKFCGQCSVRSDWLDFVVHAKSSQPDSREFYFFVRRCSSVREVWFEKGVGFSRAPRVCLRDKGFVVEWEFVLDIDCSLALSQWVLASRCRQSYVLCQRWDSVRRPCSMVRDYSVSWLSCWFIYFILQELAIEWFDSSS